MSFFLPYPVSVFHLSNMASTKYFYLEFLFESRDITLISYLLSTLISIFLVCWSEVLNTDVYYPLTMTSWVPFNL